MLAANDCRVVLTFLQRSPSFSLQAQAGSNTITSPGMSANVRSAYFTSTYNLNSYDSRTRARAAVFTKKTYHNVARQSPLIFSIFLHQISCRRGQSNFETTSAKSEACPTMPCISLVFIFLLLPLSFAESHTTHIVIEVSPVVKVHGHSFWLTGKPCHCSQHQQCGFFVVAFHVHGHHCSTFS